MRYELRTMSGALIYADDQGGFSVRYSARYKWRVLAVDDNLSQEILRRAGDQLRVGVRWQETLDY